MNPILVANLVSYILMAAREQATDQATVSMLESTPPCLIRQVLIETIQELAATYGCLEDVPQELRKPAFDKAAEKLILIRTAN